MKVSSIEINNFKGLKKESFSPKSFSCLVGENNAGKSTVLQALVYALNRPRKIPSSCFYDQEKPIIFTLNFSGIRTGDLNRLTEEHRTKIIPLIHNGNFSLIVEYKYEEAIELLVSKLVPIEEKYREEAIKDNFNGIRSAPQARTAIESHYPEFLENLPDNCTLKNTKEYLSDCIKNMDNSQFKYEPKPLPSGIPSSISVFLPEPIYIPAVKNFEDDLKITQSTSFGKLISLLMGDLTPDLQDINETLIDLKKRLNRFKDEDGNTQDQRLPKVIELEKTIEGFLSESFPNVSIDLDIQPPEIKTILSTAQIYIDDGSRDLIDNKGDGVKRSLTFSLLRTYVDLISRQNNEPERLEDNERQILEKPRLFLFEEPELYLHPKAQKILFNTLSRISNLHQTVITTHSPLFFEPGITAQFVRVAKKDVSPKPIGKLYPIDIELDKDNLNTFRMARYDHAEAAFFSSHILLYEGDSDDFFFKNIAKTLNTDWNFEERNIALVKAGGKGNFSKYRRFFELFGLKVSILTDLDAVTKDFKHLGANTEQSQLHQTLIQHLDQRAIELNITPDLTGQRVKGKVKNPRWIEKYETAKEVVKQVIEDGNASAEQLDKLHVLFQWENEEARYKVITKDEMIKDELIELIDSLRGSGIYILSKGAIEEYYPDEIPSNCSKPERALKVIEYITSQEIAMSISQPLKQGRASEFEEIFESIFQ